MSAPAVSIHGTGERVGKEPRKSWNPDPTNAKEGHSTKEERSEGLKIREGFRSLSTDHPGDAEDDDENDEWEPLLHGWTLEEGVGLDHFKIIHIIQSCGIVPAATFEVDLADTLLITEDFDLLTEFFTNGCSVTDRWDFHRWAGAVGSIEMEIRESKNTKPKGFGNFGVLYAVEFHFIDLLVEDALINSETLAGELKDAAASAEPEPSSISEREDDDNCEEGEKDRRSNERDDDDYANHERPKVDDL